MPQIGKISAVVTLDDSGFAAGTKRVKSGMKGLAEGGSEVGKSAKGMGEAIRGADGRLRDINGRFVKTGAESKKAAASISQSAGVMSQALGVFAGNLLGKGVGAIAGFVKQGIEGFANLDQAVANISTIKPEINTKAVFDSLNAMQTRVPQSAKELGESLYDVFSTVNVSQKEGLQLVEKFAKGAVGAQTDAKTFGTATMGVLNAFKLGVKDADHVADLFFNTVKAGVVTGPQLAAGLGPVAASAKAAGQSVETAFAAMAASTKAGGEASQNLNNINNLFQKITTDKAKEGFAALNIQLSDSKGKFRQIGDVVKDFIEKTKGLSDVAKADAINKIFPDAQARQGFQVLIGQYKDFTASLDENIHKSGAARDAYEKMSGTFQSQSKIIKNSFDAIVTEVGAEILPAITPLIKAFAQQLPDALKATKTFLAPVSKDLKAFIDGTSKSFQTEWPKIKAAAIEAFKPIRPIIDDIVKWVRENFPLMQKTVQTVLNTIKEFWKAHGAQIMAVVRPLINAILGVFKFLMQFITGDFKGAFKTAVDVIKNLFSAAWEAIKLFFSLVTDLLKRNLTALKHLGEGIASNIVDGLTGGLSSRTGKVADAAGKLGTTVSGSVAKKLDMHSPSRVMHQLGVYAGQGLVLGLLSQEKTVEDAGTKLGKRAHKGVKSELDKQKDAYKKEIASLLTQIDKLRSGAAKTGAQATEAGRFSRLSAAQQNYAVHLRTTRDNLISTANAEKTFRDELNKTNASIRGRATAKTGEDPASRAAFDIRFKTIDPKRRDALWAAKQTDLGQHNQAEQVQQGLARLKDVLGDAKAKYIELTTAKALSTATTEKERIALQEFHTEFNKLPKELQAAIEPVAAQIAQNKQFEASTKAAAKALRDAAKDAKDWTTFLTSAQAKMNKHPLTIKPLVYGPPKPTAAQQAERNRDAKLEADHTARISGQSNAAARAISESIRGGLDDLMSQPTRFFTTFRTRLVDSLRSGIADSITNSAQNSLKKSLMPIFENLGSGLKVSLAGINQSAIQILQAGYGLLAAMGAMGKKRQGGGLIGGLLGGIAGSLIPGVGTLLGAKIGSSLGGALSGGNPLEIGLAGLGAYTSLSGAGVFGGGGGSVDAPGGGLGSGNLLGNRLDPPHRSISVTQNNYGPVNQAASIQSMRDELGDAIDGVLRS